MSETYYIYVAPHIITLDGGEWSTCYDSDYEKFPTKRKALRHGLKTLDHDDFWVCEMKDGKLVKIYHSDLEPRPIVTDDDREEFEHAKQEISLA